MLYFLLSQTQLVKGKKQSQESIKKNYLLTEHSTNSCKFFLVSMRIDIFQERKYGNDTCKFAVLVGLFEAKTISWHNQLSCELIPPLVDATERSGVVGPVPK